MSVIILLLIASVLVAGGFLMAYIWSVEDGQYDDIESHATRILIDESIDTTPKK